MHTCTDVTRNKYNDTILIMTIIYNILLTCMAASRHFLLVVLVSGFDDKMHINSTSSACIMSKNSVLM